MCHLTVTGQTSFVDSTRGDFLAQANQVFRHYRRQKAPACWMHYNFMARGEPLANRLILDDATDLLGRLGALALDEGLPAKFNVSTIMPATLRKSLVEVFPIITPTIYYSLYSTRHSFREKWLPTAMPPPEALRMLKEYQRFSKKAVKIHHALIAGENDDEEDAVEIGEALRNARLHCEFNLVRYNPATPAQGAEAPEARRALYLNTLEHYVKGKIQTIPRVGFDVNASCGMFAGKDGA